MELRGPEYVALVFARSGLAVKNGLTLSNGVGVIDSDYRGEISVGLVNLSDKPYTVQNGERIAQLAVMPVACPTCWRLKRSPTQSAARAASAPQDGSEKEGETMKLQA